MRKKKLKQLEEEAVELEQVAEPEQAPVQEEQVQEVAVEPTEDEYKAKIETLTEELRVLAEKENNLTDKLCEAKKAGSKEQTDRCRELLQYLVYNKKAKQEELETAKAGYRKLKQQREIAELTAQIDQIEADILGNQDPEAIEEEVEPSFEPEYDYEAKAKRLSTASKVIALLGCFGGLVGALVYMVLVFLKDHRSVRC